MRTIRIDGQDLTYEGLTPDRKGIRSGGKVFWMFPAVKEGGGNIEDLPPIGPSVIRRVTVDMPDLTSQYPETLKEIFEKRRAYHENISLEEHVRNYPGDGWITPEQFEQARTRILAEPIEQFAKSERAIRYVWDRHGTEEIADKVGLLDMSKQILLHFWLKVRMPEAVAWSETHRIKWAAHYNDPDHTIVYLYDLIEEPEGEAGQKAQPQLEPKQRNTPIELPPQNLGSLSEISSALAKLKNEQNNEAIANAKRHEETSGLLRRQAAATEASKEELAKLSHSHEAFQAMITEHLKRATTEGREPIVEFLKEFKGVKHLFGPPLTLRATYRPKVLQHLFKNWQEGNSWIAWESIKQSLTLQSDEADPYRMLFERGGKNPMLKRIVEDIVEREKTPEPTGVKYRIRLNPKYQYKVQS